MSAETPHETVRRLQDRLEHYEMALDPHCCAECREGLRQEHADLTDLSVSLRDLIENRPDYGIVAVSSIRELLERMDGA